MVKLGAWLMRILPLARRTLKTAGMQAKLLQVQAALLDPPLLLQVQMQLLSRSLSIPALTQLV
jgi:hypothetical protein